LKDCFTTLTFAVAAAAIVKALRRGVSSLFNSSCCPRGGRERHSLSRPDNPNSLVNYLDCDIHSFTVLRTQRKATPTSVQDTDAHSLSFGFDIKTALLDSNDTSTEALMATFSCTKMLTAALSALLALPTLLAAPMPQNSISSRASGYWLSQTGFHLNDPVFGNSDSNYPLFRNVMDTQFNGGAKGDGTTDDTNAIQAAISSTLGSDSRCGPGCNSSTTTPALVYFPPGKYLVHQPLNLDYYTQLVGDAINPPTILASSNFTGMAVIDADPYGQGVEGNGNWFINQNNFFRQIRNFIIDITAVGGGESGAGIHWQVAQATSLQNIVFEMSTSKTTKQQGIFMDNGSGGFMSDLTFNGGLYGAFLGSQQFTSRNLVFNGCQTGIFMNWNWGWTLSNMTFNNCGTGVDMSNSPTNQTVGSVVLSDSTFSGTTYGVRSAYKPSGNVPVSGGSLLIDNVDFGSATSAVVDPDDGAILSGGGVVKAWGSGNVYDNSGTKKATQGQITAPHKDSSLLNNGNIFGRSKPQYETAQASDFLQAKTDGGCKGDGTTDDTTCVQSFLKSAASANKIAYFNHGVYKVTDTIAVPSTIRIVGEVWSTIFASGFSDASNPKPVWQVGTDGQTGAVEISDMLFEIDGPNPGAIIISWGLNSAQGASGMWDTHVRIGGSAGSDLLLANCPYTADTVNDKCIGAFLMFHATPKSGGVYCENTWFWTADHDMENPANLQIDVYTGRGALIQSSGPVWLWGTASEHSILYNYQIDGAGAVFGGFMQSETPYFQPQPLAPAPFNFNSAYDDPTFTVCSNGGNTSADAVPCKDAWGLRVANTKSLLVYSAGFYNFFNDYNQDCVAGQNCQENMIHVQNSQVSMYAVTTKAAVNMLIDDVGVTVPGADNRDVYGDTIAYYNSNA
jgi:glucan 1,3-beta-glucosidase